MPDFHIAEAQVRRTAFGGLEHCSVGVNGDDFADEWGEEGKHRPGAGPDIHQRPIGIKEREHAFEVKPIAEPLGADLVPLGGVFAEKGFCAVGAVVLGFALAQDRAQAMFVISGDGIGFKLPSNHDLQLMEIRVGGLGIGIDQAVEDAGPLAAGTHEVGIGEGFEVAGDGGLREFEDLAELPDRQARGHGGTGSVGTGGAAMARAGSGRPGELRAIL